MRCTSKKTKRYSKKAQERCTSLPASSGNSFLTSSEKTKRSPRKALERCTSDSRVDTSAMLATRVPRWRAVACRRATPALPLVLPTRCKSCQEVRAGPANPAPELQTARG